MKKILATLFVSLVAQQAGAQEYLDAMAKRSCDCVGKLAPTANKNLMNVQVGVCILQSAGAEDKANLLNDFQINLNEPQKDGRRAGELIGTRMAAICPATIVKLSAQDTANNGGSVYGKISKIETESFVSFSLQESNGKMNKYIWLTQATSDVELTTVYKNLSGKNVRIQFEVKDMFDPKIGEYRPFKVITDLHVN